MGLYVELLRHLTQVLKKTFITVDLIISRPDGSIVLVKRSFEPFKDYWALPGGFLEYGHTVEETAIREAKEETGLEIHIEKVVGVYSHPKRDPRGHIISICLLTKEIGGELAAGSDAKEAKGFKEPPKELAFDHSIMLKDAGLPTKV